jgi:hypothetical protein
MEFLVNLVKSTATELFTHWANKGGEASGGFYFEWNDEYYKSGWKGPEHIGGANNGTVVQNAAFPGCYNDEGWYGLNSNNADFIPNRHIGRRTLNAIKAVWAAQR